MTPDRRFPIDITDEERKAGFRLVRTRRASKGFDIPVAALSLNPSARIVKVRVLPLYVGDSAPRYLLQAYCSDPGVSMPSQRKPKWIFVWSVPSNTLEAALHRFHTEPLDPSLELFDAPEEEPVESPGAEFDA